MIVALPRVHCYRIEAIVHGLLGQTRSQGGFGGGGGGGGSVEPPFQGAGSEFLIKEATPLHTVNSANLVR